MKWRFESEFKDPKMINLTLLRISIVFTFLWHGIPKAIDPAIAMEIEMGL